MERNYRLTLMMNTPSSSRADFRQKISYAARWMPDYLWQRLTRHLPKRSHVMVAMADHFEPAVSPEGGRSRVPYDEQERRLERWCEEYPRRFANLRDADGRPFVHTYFYPAEQYDNGLLSQLADHANAGWGEIEVHLHHGAGGVADTPENTRCLLLEFRDLLAHKHSCLSYAGESDEPRYAFVHGNFALANSYQGRACGVDSEMQILAETGCYADMTLPSAPFHPTQIRKVNSLYECGLPLTQRAPHRKGTDLQRGRTPQKFPIMVQGPLLFDYRANGHSWGLGIDNAAVTTALPASLHRWRKWKSAAIGVKGRPEWLFIKLHCHGMYPKDENALLGPLMQQFLGDLLSSAPQRGETLHFVTAREMVNIILAACDGREGNPRDYRDYRFKRGRSPRTDSCSADASAVLRQ